MNNFVPTVTISLFEYKELVRTSNLYNLDKIKAIELLEEVQKINMDTTYSSITKLQGNIYRFLKTIDWEQK